MANGVGNKWYGMSTTHVRTTWLGKVLACFGGASETA